MEPTSPYGMAGGIQRAGERHPQERETRRRAVAAAMLQLISPFLFVGMLFLGLTTEIPTHGDPHGYVQIFGFFASFLLLIPGIGLPAIAIPLLRKARPSGAVVLIVAAAMWLLLFATLASGYPGGITELAWNRVLTILVGLIWAGLCGWCIWAGATAFSRFPRT